MIFWTTLVVVLDRISKIATIRYLRVGESHTLIDGILYATHVRNPGAAFGLLPQMSVLLTVLSALITLGLIAFYIVSGLRGNWINLGVGLMVGGAIGNLVDRIQWGHVVDFIDLRFWPVFNVADIGVTVGGAIIIALLIRDELI